MSTQIQPDNHAIETLFRFLYLAPAKKRRTTVANIGSNFIAYPALENSEILRNAAFLSDSLQIKEALAESLAQFSPLKSRRELTALHPDLLQLGEWLEEQGIPASQIELEAVLPNVAMLSNSELGVLWDNLYYQSLRPGSIHLSNSLITLIRANYFLLQWQDHVATSQPYDQVAIARLEAVRKIRVLLPPVLGNFRTNFASNTLSHLSTGNDVVLWEVGRKSAKRREIQILSACKSAMEAVEQQYHLEYRAAFDAAWGAHLEATSQLKAAAGTSINPETGELAAASFTQPIFSFEFPALLSVEYLESRLSAQQFAIYQSFVRPHHRLLSDIFPELAQKIKNATQDTTAIRTHQTKTAFWNGNAIQLARQIAPNRFGIQAYPLPGIPLRYQVVLTFNAAQPLQRFDSLTLRTKAQVNAKVDRQTSWQEMDDMQVFHFFVEGVDLEDEEQIYFLNGLRQGKEIEVQEFSAGELLRGQARFSEGKHQNGFLDGEPGTPWNMLPGVRKIGIGEFKRVEAKICCYVPGEVSHIENIMAREFKERISRSLISSETTTEESEEREIEKLADSTTADRYEMQSEISKALSEVKSRNWGTTAAVQSEAFGVQVQASGYFNSSSSSSSSSNFSEAETFAREVTLRALERVTQKTTWKRTTRMLQEFEDTHRHGFDNTKGDAHVVGVYRWVDKIYENNLVNYGKRLMYELMLPEPSKLFKKALEGASAPSNTVLIAAPPTPISLGLTGPADLTAINCGMIAAAYSASVPTPPDPSIHIGFSFAESIGDTAYNDTAAGSILKDAKAHEIELPEGYFCSSVRVKAGLTLHGNSNNGPSILFVGPMQITINEFNQPSSALYYTIVPSAERHLPISIRTVDAVAYSINGIAICTAKASLISDWQQTSYAIIMEAYQRQLRDYEEALAAQASQSLSPAGKDYNFNPAIHRTIEMRELKRIAIELMTKRFGYDIGQDNYQNYTGGYYPVRQDNQFAQHAALARFFEQAFDWEIMSYAFHPYFWADESTWEGLIRTTSSSDFIFQSFLQAGMAQATLPVRPGFEQSVMFYLDTGTLWNGTGFALEDDEELYLAAHQSLQMVEGEVEATWTTRVPTALTILQSGAAALQANGLPCFCEDGTPIATGQSLLNGGGNEVDPCLAIADEVSVLQTQFQALIGAMSLGTQDCHQTLHALQALSTTIKALIARAQAAGCPAEAALALEAAVLQQFTAISATCI
jgi:hypothetical protein